ncbi:MAG: hypothetical protein NVSMB64_12650 [Candidatus Velthaea sp.]
MKHPSDDEEPSATEERIAENRVPAPVAPATRDAKHTEPSGLPPGVNDDRRSPLDAVFYDPATKDEKQKP